MSSAYSSDDVEHQQVQINEHGWESTASIKHVPWNAAQNMTFVSKEAVTSRAREQTHKRKICLCALTLVQGRHTRDEVEFKFAPRGTRRSQVVLVIAGDTARIASCCRVSQHQR